MSLSPVLHEILTVAETEPGEFSTVLNTDFFVKYGVSDPKDYIKSLAVIARDEIIAEMANTKVDAAVTVDANSMYSHFIVTFSLYFEPETGIVSIEYVFGDKTPKGTSKVFALAHIVEVLSELELLLNR